MQKIAALIAFIIIFSSCMDRSKNEEKAFKVIEEGLSRSNKQIQNETISLFESLKEKLQDPKTKEQAEIWQPKAMLVQALSGTLKNYIENLKTSFGNEDRVKPRKLQELSEKLQHYKQQMLAIDPEINRIFEDRFTLTTAEYDADMTKQKSLSSTFFDDILVIAVMPILSTFENNISILENQVVEFCKNKTGYLDGGYYEAFNPVVTQSSQYLKAGDEIEISAGIGTFRWVPDTKIIINGKNIPFKENTVATYKFKTPLKAGKYFVPVRIEFIRPDGSKAEMSKNLEYTVAE